MNAASSFTQPISAEPRVYCQVSPRKKSPWHIGHTATMAQAPLRVQTWKVDPRVVGPVTGRPDHRVHLHLGSVLRSVTARALEAPRSRAAGPRRRGRRSRLFGARADQRVPLLEPPSQPRLDGRRKDASSWLATRKDRVRAPAAAAATDECPLTRLATLCVAESSFGDLKAGVPTPDDEDRPPEAPGSGLRYPVACVWNRSRYGRLGKLRDVGPLERTGGDHHLVGGERPSVGGLSRKRPSSPRSSRLDLDGSTRSAAGRSPSVAVRGRRSPHPVVG